MGKQVVGVATRSDLRDAGLGLKILRPGRRALMHFAAGLAGTATLASARSLFADSCEQPARQPIEGPYFLGEPEEKDDTGTQLVVRGRVTDNDCNPIVGATVVRWHANRFGTYEEYFRAAMVTGENGTFSFSTIFPGAYANLDRHIHFVVGAPNTTSVIAQIQWTDDETIPAEEIFDFSLVGS